MVSQITIIFMVIAVIMGFALPAGAALFCKFKFNSKFRPFIAGCIVFFAFVVVLESLVHSIMLGSDVGELIQKNIFFYALYGGLMAGLFEETGRLFAFKYFFRKDMDDDHDALMYAAGHGGFEAFYILVSAMISNLIMARLINSGQTDVILQNLSGDALIATKDVINQLITIEPVTFLFSILERISAMLMHVAFSVFVWFAVKENKYILFGIAILLHAAVDAITVLINSSISSVLLVEVIIFALALVCDYMAYMLYYRRNLSS